jgi:hypothetical protein
MLRIFSILFVVAAVASCQAGQETEHQKAKEEVGKVMSIEVKSSAFEEGGIIPRKHTCDGEDLSPALSWSGVPEGTKSLALICDDPDAPMGTWVHWVIYGIPADTTGLPEAVSAEKTVLEGMKQGITDFRRIGYGGPCPPSGAPHRYFFKLYALDAELALDSGITKKQLLTAMEGHILAQGQLMGKYGR